MNTHRLSSHWRSAQSFLMGSVSRGEPLPWSPNASWRDAEYCVIDIETTGLNPASDRIVSLGAVPVRGGRILAGESTYMVFNPGCEMEKESIKIHGLTPETLASAPLVEQCVDTIRQALEGRILVAHTAWVERSFLFRELPRHGIHLIRPMVDTAQLISHLPGLPLIPESHEISLEYASAILGLPPYTPHHALGDAMTTAQLFVTMARLLSPGDQATVSDLLVSRK